VYVNDVIISRTTAWKDGPTVKKTQQSIYKCRLLSFVEAAPFSSDGRLLAKNARIFTCYSEALEAIRTDEESGFNDDYYNQQDTAPQP